MRRPFFLLAICLLLSPSAYAHSGGGGGGGGHNGGGGHQGNGSRGHSNGGHEGNHTPSRGHNGDWQNHAGHYNGRGGWNSHNWNGHNYNSWRGPYYYGGFGWWAGGLFLVGFTFYTCTIAAIAATNTWAIQSDDVDTYRSWPDQENVTIMQVEDDSEWPYRLCYNDGSCVRARPAQGQ